jgi:hypothetical protein
MSRGVRHYKRWSREDDRRLCLLWGTATVERIAAQMGRTPLTVYWRGRKLGLPCGVPERGEYLTHAAKRTGFATQQLRVVLRAAGVRLRQTMSAPRDTSRTYHWVDPFDVDEAVALWMSTETADTAAQRLGVCGDTIVRLMAVAGVEPLKTARKRQPKQHRRYRTEDVDRVVAAWRAGHSIAEHARRLRVSRTVLANRLRAVGLLGAKHPGNGGRARLTIEAVDAALARRAA